MTEQIKPRYTEWTDAEVRSHDEWANTITDPVTKITRPVCQDKGQECWNPGSYTCEHCGGHTCGQHTRWHHDPDRTTDVVLCIACNRERKAANANVHSGI